MVLNENGEVMEERGLNQRGWGLRAPPLDPQPMVARQEKQPDEAPGENDVAEQHGKRGGNDPTAKEEENDPNPESDHGSEQQGQADPAMSSRTN